MTPLSNRWQTIAWNGLSLSCPARWEVIVSGKRHLLFEENFTPIFELRWENNDSLSNRNAADSIVQHLEKEYSLHRPPSLSSPWHQLKQTYQVILLAAGEDEETKGALLTCRHSGTILLFYFFPSQTISPPELSKLLSSLSCNPSENKESLWAIQDFRILLPQSYELSSYNFAAGLTRLTFSNSGRTMHLCRLTQASLHLQTTTLADLMVLLSGISPPPGTIVCSDQSVCHHSQPSTFQQILTRLKRKPPYHRMILRHHPEYDRLTGLFFEDKKPISQQEVNTILDSYEILPL